MSMIYNYIYDMFDSCNEPRLLYQTFAFYTTIRQNLIICNFRITEIVSYELIEFGSTYASDLESDLFENDLTQTLKNLVLRAIQGRLFYDKHREVNYRQDEEEDDEDFKNFLLIFCAFF
ncbi:hypothetical protein BpHYR1_032204 [Brachionus plicatilis]|uniref:Uncharacterized protein n=1 Tax=Brachionus plicatilis TaxID=10195 RepID=A0A3M7Q7J3_BRAPC|nr:hypothetical protein BpHYR1_032204 [Brachionus plicatilis]